MTDLAKLDKKQLKAWAREQDKARVANMLEIIILNPVVALVGGFVAIDYFEHKQWKDEAGLPSGNTMLGPAAANVVRTGLVAGPAMDALGKLGKVGKELLPLLALSKGVK